MTTETFKTGQTYSTRSICDYECIFAFTVVKRTEKTVTLKDRHGRTVNRRIRIRNGVEECDPLGRYSMSPIIDATDRA